MSKAVERSAPFELRADSAGDGLTLNGVAAVFNTPTRIDSWEGMFDEEIAPGAFRKTIRESKPVLQFDHGRHPMVGSIPIGAITSLREGSDGLHVEARLHDNDLVKPVRDAIDSKAIHGMSFRFMVVKDEWRDAKGNVITDQREIDRMVYARDPKNVPQRTLKEIRMPELGPVVFPAYTSTTVGVRSDEAVAAILADPTALAALRRALTDLGTPTGAAETTTEPGDHSADHRNANAFALAALPPLPRKAHPHAS